MPMQPGSPTRLEAGQANGAEATSPTGNVNAGVGILGLNDLAEAIRRWTGKKKSRNSRCFETC